MEDICLDASSSTLPFFSKRQHAMPEGAKLDRAAGAFKCWPTGGILG